MREKHITIKLEKDKYELYIVCGQYSRKIKNVNCKTFNGAVRSAKKYAEFFAAEFNECDSCPTCQCKENGTCICGKEERT